MTWLLLTYIVPRHPSASRVYVWRKLKKLGAIPLQDAAWILPATPATREHFQWLAAEITELQGQVTLWEASSLLPDQEQRLIRQFQDAAGQLYRSILRDLRRGAAALPDLSRRYQQALALDYLPDKLGRQVRAALIKKTEGKSS